MKAQNTQQQNLYLLCDLQLGSLRSKILKHSYDTIIFNTILSQILVWENLKEKSRGGSL